MNDDFKEKYLGRFPEDSIIKALKKSYVAVADPERMLFLPQSIIKNGIEAIKHGTDSEKVLVAVLESMGRLINDLHRQAMDRHMLEVPSIIMTTESHEDK